MTNEISRPLPPGVYVSGLCRGTRVEQIRTQEGPRDRHTIGIEIQVPDGWGGHKSELVVIRLSDAQVREGAAGQAQQLVGRHVAISVWVQAWAGQRGAGFSFQMSNGTVILDMEA